MACLKYVSNLYSFTKNMIPLKATTLNKMCCKSKSIESTRASTYILLHFLGMECLQKCITAITVSLLVGIILNEPIKTCYICRVITIYYSESAFYSWCLFSRRLCFRQHWRHIACIESGKDSLY